MKPGHLDTPCNSGADWDLGGLEKHGWYPGLLGSLPPLGEDWGLVDSRKGLRVQMPGFSSCF